MSTVNTTVNVNESCPVTPGTFNVRAHYSEVDAGHVYGPFASREAADTPDMEFDNKSIVAGGTIAISSMTLTVPIQ